MSTKVASRIIYVALLGLASSTATGAEGRVFDKTTGKPVQGAFIIQRSDGRIPGVGHSSAKCFHAAVAQTNESGVFAIPDPGKSAVAAVDRNTFWTVYKPGYKEVDRKGKGSTPSVLWLEPRSKATFEEVSDMLLSLGCERRDGSQWLPLLRAKYAEEKELARTAEQHKQADALLFEIDQVELGRDAAEKKLNDRMRERMLRERNMK